MKTNRKLALAVLAGVLIGVGGVMVIHAQQTKTAPGYFIAEVQVSDPAKMQQYVSQFPPTLAPFHHEYLVRGDKIQALEGEAPKGAVIIIAFDSVEQARAWYDSPAYAAIRPIRQSAATTRAFIVEAVAK